jgi:hypothetical protein
MLQSCHLLLDHTNLATFSNLLRISGNFLWRITLKDLAAILIILNKNCETLHILQFITTGLGILNLTTNVSVAITIEHFTTLFLLIENFDIGSRKCNTCCNVGYF